MTRPTKRYEAAWYSTVLAGLTLPFCDIALSDPSPKSVASVAACLTAENAVLACASKELSNVVIQCSNSETETTSYFKYDDLAFEEDNPYFALLASPYQGAFPCPEGTGDPVAVFIKSGSAKTPRAGEFALLPPGSGVVPEGELLACPAELTELCPSPSVDDEEEEEEEDETN